MTTDPTQYESLPEDASWLDVLVSPYERAQIAALNEGVQDLARLVIPIAERVQWAVSLRDRMPPDEQYDVDESAVLEAMGVQPIRFLSAGLAYLIDPAGGRMCDGFLAMIARRFTCEVPELAGALAETRMRLEEQCRRDDERHEEDLRRANGDSE
jgi:hypothetical protein